MRHYSDDVIFLRLYPDGFTPLTNASITTIAELRQQLEEVKKSLRH